MDCCGFGGSPAQLRKKVLQSAAKASQIPTSGLPNSPSQATFAETRRNTQRIVPGMVSVPSKNTKQLRHQNRCVGSDEVMGLGLKHRIPQNGWRIFLQGSSRENETGVSKEIMGGKM